MKNFSYRFIAVTFIAFLFLFAKVYALPLVVAHRGGNQNYPENTLFAFSKALEMGADAIELDIQLTKDGRLAVYHPGNLEIWTNGSGTIASRNWEYISKLDAGYNYKPEEGYPFRGKGLRVPTLRDVVCTFPGNLFIIDLKSLPADALINALAQTISDEQAQHLIFYSTDAEHIRVLNQQKPLWRTFEKRDLTRQRLLDLNQTGRTNLPISSHWMAFELKRKMDVIETFSLGTGISSVEFHLWNPETVHFLRDANPHTFILLFGINTPEEWHEAVKLDVNAVCTDNPLEILKMRA